ncbi:Jag N-terminal domain-containing protein [uncultured Helicobacter sp.]|uniref:Jag N-terminal domain-containing protein n=1 Tax=uncultured Helicobacter sp. TaxID=175537 RepID=UPI0026085F15|nr:Jag N-terminal domain-containing protein [uncultured Helicobacter sp.]
MKKIEAETLENALIIASNDFGCSVVDLEYEIIQNPSKGFLGIGKKHAIICAQPKILLKVDSSSIEVKTTFNSINEESFQSAGKMREENEPLIADEETRRLESLKYFSLESSKKDDSQEAFKNNPRDFNVQFVSKIPNHIKHKQLDLQNVAKEVQRELQELLSLMPYQLSEILVEPYDENTLYIKIDGEDSALLIGKEGYRYKAISYLIFNWVNHVYGVMIRLEIAEFLRNQEEMIANYLLPTIESIKMFGKAQTKPLDGVLAHIALKQLREQFPDKYISFRLNNEGERYIIINDFHHS